MGLPNRIGQELRRWRAFFFTVIVVALVWILSSMAEPKPYEECYALCFDGIDTARYAVTAADSTVTLTLTSNGFYALRRSINKPRTLHIRVAVPDAPEASRQFSFPTSTLADLFRKQLDMRGVSLLQPKTERISLELAERECRSFAPDITPVLFEFDGMTGLCGQPIVKPDSVKLYGSRASLDKISHLAAAKQTIRNITHSGHYRIKLDPVWEQYPDLRPSHQSVTIYIPTATYIEKHITLPVKLQGSLSTGQVNLYPAEVTLTCLVPETDYESLTANDFSVCATLFSDTDAYLTPQLTQFPAQVRVRSIQPQQIHYIIIK